MLTVEAPKFTVLPKEGAHAPATVRATFDVDTSCVPQGMSTASRRYTIDWGDSTETTVHEVTPSPCSTVIPGPQTITQQSFVHPYTDSGSRTVRLSVSNGIVSYNASSSVNLGSTKFTVSPSFFTDPPYNAEAVFDIDQSCSASPSGATATYTVDWGDGTTPSVRTAALPTCGTTHSANVAVDQRLPHTYAKTGDFTARLTVTRSDVPGGAVTKTKGVGVHTSTTTYLWSTFKALLTGDESLTAAANNAASAFYLWSSGK
ncbi:MAG: hypothetical protein RI911_37 [Candidatus Parcubacteria bacterium]